jgi:hypothetical protein
MSYRVPMIVAAVALTAACCTRPHAYAPQRSPEHGGAMDSAKTGLVAPTFDRLSDRNRIVAKLRDSGKDDSPAAGRGRTAMRRIASSMSKARFARLSAPECYRAGCVAEAFFRDEPTFSANATRLGGFAKAQWGGPVLVSSALPAPNGKFSSLVVLFADETSEPPNGVGR